jgi:nitrile hydratase alpha subunit
MTVHIRTQEEIAARVKALEALMIEKGIMTTAAIDRLAEIYENEVGPQLGAAVVAKAWSDPEFKARPGCSPTPPRRAPRWASAACRARTWSRSRTPTPCTT